MKNLGLNDQGRYIEAEVYCSDYYGETEIVLVPSDTPHNVETAVQKALKYIDDDPFKLCSTPKRRKMRSVKSDSETLIVMKLVLLYTRRASHFRLSRSSSQRGCASDDMTSTKH